MLIGRLGRDPEIKYTNSGTAVANFSIATSESWKDKNGQKQERTEWHGIVAWGKLAEFAQNYLKKGNLIYAEGRLQTRDWTDEVGVKHYRTETVVTTINFMEKKGDSKPEFSADSGAPAAAQPCATEATAGPASTGPAGRR